MSVVAAATAGCAAALFVPPGGPGENAPEARAAFTDATRACRAASSYVATIYVSGRLGDHGLPAVRVVTGATASGGLRLEASAHNTEIFKLASPPGGADRATLLLYDGNRSFVGSAEDIVDALIGVRIGPARWFALFTGCGTISSDVRAGERFDALLAVTTGDGRAFLRRQTDGWRIEDVTFDDFVVTYRTRVGDWPRAWSLGSLPGRDPVVRLNVRVEHEAIDTPLTDQAFALDVRGSSPMTLDELRASGPFGGRARPSSSAAGRAPETCADGATNASTCRAR